MSESTEPTKPTAIECRFVSYIQSINRRDDIHLIKEVKHMPDGTHVPNKRILFNYKRPYWITTEANRNHVEKKEYEKRSRVKEHTSTQTQLVNEVARKLRMNPGGNLRLSMVNKSPFVYGTDVSAATIIKERYLEAFPDTFTPYAVAALDFETDMSTKEELPIMGVFSFKKKARLTCHQKMISHIRDPKKAFWDACSKMQTTDGRTVEEHLKERGLWHNVELEICKDNLEVVSKLTDAAHLWSPDIVSIWNMDFDVSKMMQTFEAYGVNPYDYLSDPIIPREFRQSEYIPGQPYKKKADGSQTPVPPVDRWNTLKTASSWYVLCAMCSYKKLRPTEPKMKMALDVATKKHLNSIVDIYVKGESLPVLRRDSIAKGIYIDVNTGEKVTFPHHITGAVITKDSCTALTEEQYNKGLVNRWGDELSIELGKIKFPAADGRIGRDWHVFMQKNYPIEYWVYCLWDGVVLELLDEKTNDLSTTLPVLCGSTEFARFPSGPKKLCDNMHFFVQKHGCVVGSTSDDMTTEFCKYIQRLGDWITLLEPHLVHSNVGINCIEGCPSIRSKASIAGFDIDVKSAYPNTGDVENIAKETTEMEFCNIEHLSRDEMRPIGLNYSSPIVNAVELSTMIYRAPTLPDLLDSLVADGSVTLK